MEFRCNEGTNQWINEFSQTRPATVSLQKERFTQNIDWHKLKEKIEKLQQENRTNFRLPINQQHHALLNWDHDAEITGENDIRNWKLWT